MVEEVSVDLAAGLTEEEIAMMRAMGMPVVCALPRVDVSKALCVYMC